MAKRIIPTPSGPSALGPYSIAVETGGLVFFSGQVALKPEGGRVDDEVGEQTRQVMDNLGSMLDDAGLTFDDIVKATIFMTDINDYSVINKVYGGYFPGDPPARSAVQVGALPGGFQVEIEVVAARPGT